MWTYKLHRTKDGASLTIPKEVLRLWEPYRVARIRLELTHGGRLLMVPFTQDLREVVIAGEPTKEPHGDA